MRILLIGSSGTIGKRIYDRMSQKHEILRAGRTGSDVNVDITDHLSIEEMYRSVKGIDAVICAAGPAKFGAMSEMSEEDYFVGIRGKMMGQVNLVRIGQDHINDGGSFTLTTGILSDDPVFGATGLAMVNGAVNSFVIAAALELPRRQRINVVCPTLVEDSVDKYADVFPGYDAVSMDRVVNAYVRSVETQVSGRILRVY